MVTKIHMHLKSKEYDTLIHKVVFNKPTILRDGTHKNPGDSIEYRISGTDLFYVKYLFCV